MSYITLPQINIKEYILKEAIEQDQKDIYFSHKNESCSLNYLLN